MFGFLKKLKKEKVKINTDNSRKINSSVQSKSKTIPDNDILSEVFPVDGQISRERNNEIYDRFIACGLKEFSERKFDESTLSELTYSELCSVYNNVEWFVTNVSSMYQKEAATYKKSLRKNLIKRVREMPLYVIYADVTELPLALGESQMLIFTSESMASLNIYGLNEMFDCLKIVEIQPETHEENFGEYYCAGYEKVIIDGVVTVDLSELYSVKTQHEYGNVCIESRIRMIDYKQHLARVNYAAKNEKRELRTDEKGQLNNLMRDTIASLLENAFLLPAEVNNGIPKNISVPLIPFPDGTEYIGLFTDQYAINNYYNKAISSIAFPELIKDQYNSIKDDTKISGVLINPGREEFRLEKYILSQVFER